MPGVAKKIVLPQASLTVVVDAGAAGAIRVSIDVPGEDVTQYHTVASVDSATDKYRDGKPRRVAGTYRLLPVVLCGDGTPWGEANLWLLDMLELKVLPNMLTFASIADDLAAYRRFVEDENIEWLDFAPHKLRRPTYRYNASLRLAVQASEISAGVAKRRMANVVRFYRWLMSEAAYLPAHAPWNTSDRFVDWTDEHGLNRLLKVKTTDVAIKNSSTKDPWDDRIVDGGHLRPLSRPEQDALLHALAAIGNTEMSLIHLVSLLSGARIQTVLTFRVHHVSRHLDETVGDDIRLKAGPGTGLDTKGNKRGVLHLPKWLYTRLHTYAKSERASERRKKAVGGEYPNQLLFLSRRGAPFYEPKATRDQSPAVDSLLRHAKTGQAVRQFITERLLPEVRARLSNPHFMFRFHDLRATFGMNTVDGLLSRIETDATTYSSALSHLATLMWHSRLSTTEAYLNYRSNLALIESVAEGWHDQLTRLAQQSLGTGFTSEIN
jgi:hypothetical protein